MRVGNAGPKLWNVGVFCVLDCPLPWIVVSLIDFRVCRGRPNIGRAARELVCVAATVCLLFIRTMSVM